MMKHKDQAFMRVSGQFAIPLPYQKAAPMKVRCLPLLALWAATSLPLFALAQASAPAAKPGVQAPSARPKPPPRLMTPEEKRDTASHDLQPERPVEPQVTIPLKGKRSKSGKSGGGSIDDAAARCKAEATEAARAACREKAAQASKSR